MKKLSLLFLLLCIILASCTKTGKSSNSDTSQLIPLLVGNEWDYVTEFYDTLGNLYSTENWPNGPVSDTIINDTIWYTQLPYDSIAIMSTANEIYSYNLVDSVPDGVYLKRTEKDSEIIYHSISSVRYEKLVSFNKVYNKNGYDDVIKNVDSGFYNGSLYNYTEYYIKPGLGIVETDYYWPNFHHADNTVSFYLGSKQILKSYILH